MKLVSMCALPLALLVIPQTVLAQSWGNQNQQNQPPPAGGYGQPSSAGQMQSGGLAPPPSSATNSEEGRTEADLQEAEAEDSGRGLEWFYIKVEGGVSHLALQTFKAEAVENIGFVAETQTGPMMGAGLGFRLIFITLGPQVRLVKTDSYDLWTFELEGGLRMPLGKIEPYLTGAAGFAAMGSFELSNPNAAPETQGYNVRLGIGMDVYITETFSVGLTGNAELLGLSVTGTVPNVDRAAPDTTDPNADPAALEQQGLDQLAEANGSTLGIATTASLVVALHF